MTNAARDANRVPAIQGVSSIDLETPTPVAVNPATGAVILDGTSLYANLDTRYLKLVADNDPLTGTLDGASLDFTGHAAIGADASVGATTLLDLDETLVFVDTTGYGIFADLYLEPAGALGAATHLVAMDMQAQWNGGVDGSTHASVQGIKGEGINRSATQPINEIIGVYGKASNLGVSDVTEVIGGLFFVTNDDALGTNLGDVASAYSILARAFTDKDTGVITDRYGLYVADTTGGGLLTNQYGIYIEDMDSGSASGTNYSIYSLGGNVELTDGDLTTLGTISGGTLTDGTTSLTNGTMNAVLFTDKVKFTQVDGNEYIDSLNDGYLDIAATTGVRIVGPRLRVQGDLYVGNDGHTDPVVVMTGDHNDGMITWMEDENYFKFGADIYVDDAPVISTSIGIVYVDDFLLQTIRDDWTRDNGGGAGALSPNLSTTTNSPTEVIGGSIIMIAGTAGDGTAYSRIRGGSSTRVNWECAKNAAIEFRMKVDDMSAAHWQCGFLKDSNDLAIFENDNGDNVVDYRGDGGTASAVDEAGDTLIDNTYYVFRVETFDDGSIKFYIDGVLKHTTAIDVLNDISGNQIMLPYFIIYGDDGNPHNMWIDYIKIWQNRT